MADIAKEYPSWQAQDDELTLITSMQRPWTDGFIYFFCNPPLCSSYKYTNPLTHNKNNSSMAELRFSSMLLPVLVLLLVAAAAAAFSQNGSTDGGGGRPAMVPAMFIFGDSLIDNGNNNNLPTFARANYFPYGIDFADGPTGRFSNGYTIVDEIGMFFRLFLLNPCSENLINLTQFVRFGSRSNK